MKRIASVLATCLGLVAISAGSAEAQLWFFPDYALPAPGAARTYVAASYGRGLNDDSGKLDAFGVAVGNTSESLSIRGGVGRIASNGDSEITVGASIGTSIMQGESVNMMVQGGIGWIGEGDFTVLRFPIGVAIAPAAASAVSPWVMPRLNIVRASGGGFSETETDIGASAGVTFNFESGFGIHTALDFIDAGGGTPITFGIGGHFTLGAGS